MLEPGDGLGVEVVRRLVEQENVWLPQQETAKRDTALLAARDHPDLRVGRRAAQRVHRHLEPRVELPPVERLDPLLDLPLLLEQDVHVDVGVGKLVVDRVVLTKQIDDLLRPLLDDLAHGLRLVELRLLLEVADRVSGRDHRLANEVLVGPRHDLQERALSRSVQTDDADLRAVEVREVDVLQDGLLVVVLAHPDHGVDDLVRFRVCHWIFLARERAGRIVRRNDK
jgi:hypothetical protein